MFSVSSTALSLLLGLPGHTTRSLSKIIKKKVTAFFSPGIMVDMPIQTIDSSLVLAATSKTAAVEKKHKLQDVVMKKTKADKVDVNFGAHHHADRSTGCSTATKIKDEVKVSR
jgi:hypothetical protein